MSVALRERRETTVRLSASSVHRLPGEPRSAYLTRMLAAVSEDFAALADELYADHLAPEQRVWRCPACDQVDRINHVAEHEQARLEVFG